MSLSPISGSIIDLSPWLQARANRLTTNATDVANTLKSFENARDILNRRSSFNKVKAQLDKAKYYQDVANKVKEEDAFISDYEQKNGRKVVDTEGYTNPYSNFDHTKATPEEIKELQDTLIGDKKLNQIYFGDDKEYHSNSSGVWNDATEKALQAYLEAHPDVAEQSHIEVLPNVRERFKPATLGKDMYNDETNFDEGYSDYKERKGVNDANRKFLEDYKDNYESTLKDYGWMMSPEFDAVIEDYIINGNPSNLMQLKQNYLENKRAEAEAKNKVGDLNEAYAEAMDNVNAINTYKDQLDPNIVAEKRVSINKVVRQLRKAGRENEAKTLEQALGVKEETLTNNRINEEIGKMLKELEGLKFDNSTIDKNAWDADEKTKKKNSYNAGIKRKREALQKRIAELRNQLSNGTSNNGGRP